MLIDAYKNIEVVTEENIGEYTLDDVVMPMVGKSVRLPENEDLKKIYGEYMDKDGITLKMFEAKSMESGCAHGAYRHIGKWIDYFNCLNRLFCSFKSKGH